MLDLYLEELFPGNLKENLLLLLLLDMSKTSNHHKIEISRKVKGNKLHQSRLNLMFRSDLIQRYKDCVSFIDKLSQLKGITINNNDILSLLQYADFQKLNLVVAGVDLFDEPEKCRAKVWFQFDKCPNLMYQAILKHGYNSDILNLIMNEKILIGFDYYLDGRFTFKIHFYYGDYSLNKITQAKLANYFDNRVLKAMEISDSFYISFRRKSWDKFIYFFNSNIENLFQTLEVNEPLYSNALDFHGIKPYIAGVFHDDIIKRDLTEYNLYYILEER